MKLKKIHWIGIIFSLIIFSADFYYFRGENLFYFLVGIALVVVGIPFIGSLIIERNVEKDKNERFLEFTRNLAESVKTGTLIGQSIINMQNKNFGSLSDHVQKLANQISLGIPIQKALKTFGDDIGSNSVKRAIALIREAENAGGEIDDILNSVSKSIYQIEKLRKERKAAVYNVVVQGYVIFFIFIGIMLVMQFKVLPLTSEVGSISSFTDVETDIQENEQKVQDASQSLARPFLFLLLAQGLFAGLAIGKLADGRIKDGFKHSFILAVSALLISTGANVFL